MIRFIVPFILFALFVPYGVNASSQSNENLDLRCYAEEACYETRKKLYPFAQEGEGFFPSSEYREALRACGLTMRSETGEVVPAGFCQPLTETETQISIGGRSSFPDVATYIAFIYRYAVFVAMTLAVVMIVVAGVQWTASAGEAQAIAQAKKRIGNAIAGIIIVATSFVILNSISPELTALRPPQVWLVRGYGLTDPWCDAIDSSTPLALARANGDQLFLPFSENVFSGLGVTNAQNTACGSDYYIGGTAGQLCLGRICQPIDGNARTCAFRLGADRSDCEPGHIVGNIESSSFFEVTSNGITGWVSRHTAGRAYSILTNDANNANDGWTWPWIKNRLGMNLYMICEDGSYKNVDSDLVARYTPIDEDETNKTQFYGYQLKNLDTIPALQQRVCGSAEDAKGFALGIGLNEFSTSFEEFHFIGNDNGTGIDLSDRVNLADGDTQYHAECIFALDAIDRYLIQPEEFEFGLQIDIDVADVADIDNSTQERDRNRAYGLFGYSYGDCFLANTPVTIPDRYTDECDETGNCDDLIDYLDDVYDRP